MLCRALLAGERFMLTFVQKQLCKNTRACCKRAALRGRLWLQTVFAINSVCFNKPRWADSSGAAGLSYSRSRSRSGI